MYTYGLCFYSQSHVLEAWLYSQWIYNFHSGFLLFTILRKWALKWENSNGTTKFQILFYYVSIINLSHRKNGKVLNTKHFRV